MSRQTICREYTIEIFLEQKIFFFIYSCLYLRGLNNEFFYLFILKVFYLFLLLFFFFSFFIRSIYIIHGLGGKCSTVTVSPPSDTYYDMYKPIN